jgi:hypothetical protein
MAKTNRKVVFLVGLEAVMMLMGLALVLVRF